MPYIKQDKRDVLDIAINDLHRVLVNLEVDDETNNLEGNLNYTITRLLRMCYGKSYSEINAAVGMLNCVILEHYRTVAAPVEDQKRFDNGDVETGIAPIILPEITVEHSSDTDTDSGC